MFHVINNLVLYDSYFGKVDFYLQPCLNAGRACLNALIELVLGIVYTLEPVPYRTYSLFTNNMIVESVVA